MAVTRDRVVLMPTAGRIKGGLMDGWHFQFLDFHVSRRPSSCGRHVLGTLELKARVTPPNWPFPRDVVLKPEYFGGLRYETHLGARRVDCAPFIDNAYRVALAQTPEWAVRGDRTLRWRLKRGALTRLTART